MLQWLHQVFGTSSQLSELTVKLLKSVEVNSTVDTLRKDLKLVEDKLEEISKSVQENRSSPTSADISKNVMVRNLLEG
jgi:hypothetical protein